MNLAAVILAAGQGTRMKSKAPKVLFPIAGRPMIQYAVNAVHSIGSARTVIVVGHEGDQVRQAVAGQAEFVEQSQQKGTGHAVLQARDILVGAADTVMVTYGDMPLLRTETLRRLADLHTATRATVTMLTIHSDNPMGFGRILRDGQGRVIGIIEESEATPEQLAIRELNCGVYCFQGDWLWKSLPELKPSKVKQEYFLTDLIGLAVEGRCEIQALTTVDSAEVIGINTRAHLAQAEKIMRERINTALMNAGVTMTDPTNTFVDFGVDVGMDTVIEPGTMLKGATRIGSNCRIGPNAIIHNSEIGDGCEIIASVVRESSIGDHVHVGPFADLRPGTKLEQNVYIGNHAEVKNAHLGEGVHVGHFSYIGDADIGARTNIGAGTITCNYDGKAKHRTVIGQDAFIGSDTLLRAPVTVGDRSTTGAGSVVTKNVPPDAVAVGAPARVIRKQKPRGE